MATSVHPLRPQTQSERDLLSVIAVLEALLARPGRSRVRTCEWRARLTRTRAQLATLRATTTPVLLMLDDRRPAIPSSATRHDAAD